jgi:DNA repair protein RadD
VTLRASNRLSYAAGRRLLGLPEHVEPAPRVLERTPSSGSKGQRGSRVKVLEANVCSELRQALAQSVEAERRKKLRPYQYDLAVCRQTSAARRIVVQLPTGAGKSLLIEDSAAEGGRLLVLAHAEWLVDQLAVRIPGQVLKAGGQHDGSRTVIGMVQTVANRDLPAPDKIIVDEFHHAVSPTYRKILDRYPDAIVEGYTATPQRLDGQGLESVADELICGPGYGELIDDRWLKPFEVYSIPSGVDMEGAATRAGDFAQEDIKHALRRSTIFGDAVGYYLSHCRDLGGHASFWPSIEAAEAAAERFQAAGVRCHALHSKLPRDEVRALVDGLRSGSVESLASVGMIGEGLDVPGLSSVSLCRPTKSLTVYLQQSGRCNRGGEGVARVMDHVLNHHRLGLPDDDREWTLQGRIKRKAEAGSVPVWVCPECWRTNRSIMTACPCGAPKPRVVVEMEQRAAELELITRASLGDIHEMCSTPEEYAAFAAAKGKKATWAAYQYATRPSAGTNVWLMAAGEIRPSRDEYLRAAQLCGVHSIVAREAAKAMRLRW